MSFLVSSRLNKLSMEELMAVWRKKSIQKGGKNRQGGSSSILNLEELWRNYKCEEKHLII